MCADNLSMTSTLTAPRITTADMAYLLQHPTGVVVQDGAGATYPLPQLTTVQADDPDVVVLLTASQAEGYAGEAAGKNALAAKAATLDLYAQHARGLL